MKARFCVEVNFRACYCCTTVTFRYKLNRLNSGIVNASNKYNYIGNGLREFPVTLNNLQNSDTMIKKRQVTTVTPFLKP
jgi:hypothetical protein